MPNHAIKAVEVHTVVREVNKINPFPADPELSHPKLSVPQTLGGVNSSGYRSNLYSQKAPYCAGLCS